MLMPPAFACLAMVTTVEVVKVAIGDGLAGVLLLAVLVAAGGTAYGAALVIGDFVGLWPGYVRDALASLAGAIARRPATVTAA
jgi:hypothetical protein